MTSRFKVQFFAVFICIIISSIASISVSLSLKFLLDDFIIPLIGAGVAGFLRALHGAWSTWNHLPGRSDFYICLHKTDGNDRAGCIKTGQR